ncbi:MAG: hypothetical protein F6K16_15660 [Symploca sp. SIO2B6]|nr:hypothetical protein [Symploca sp. SIO2B6]
MGDTSKSSQTKPQVRRISLQEARIRATGVRFSRLLSVMISNGGVQPAQPTAEKLF